MALTSDDRLNDTRHVYACYRDIVDDVGFEWVEDGLKPLKTVTSEIWNYVYPTVLGAMESWDVGTCESNRQFAVIERNCVWEQEHGILMSWRDGAELVKISDYDGHATWGHAYNDLSKDAWIYYSVRPEMRTNGKQDFQLTETRRSLFARLRGLRQRREKDTD